jgi:OPA family glycerol-3-phosphate transporter-like MFS transporter
MQWYFVFADEAQAVKPFSPGDIVLESLARRLREPTSADRISQYVYSRLSDPTRTRLAHYNGGDDRALGESLVSDLNRIRTGPVIFDSQVFENVALAAKTKGLLQQKRREAHGSQLNRSLLLDAFPKQLLNRQFFEEHWGFLLCIFGIIGGFSGMISDRYFQSRRGPPVAICFGVMLLLTGLMAAFLYASPLIVGTACVLITAAAIGVHALMSGTAAADFGGRKATATCAGIVDGFVYLGGGIQSLCVSRLVEHGWIWWPLFLVPFTVIGGIVALKIWHELPAATRKYIAEVEQKPKLELVPE